MAKTKRPPVFKIRAEVVVWRSSDPGPRPTLMIVEECVATSMPNRCDMKALLLATVKGKLAHFGLDTTKVDFEFERCEFLAARTRNYTGSIFEDEPEWTPAVSDMGDCVDREKAVRSMTYLPYDAQEQRELYGA